LRFAKPAEPAPKDGTALAARLREIPLPRIPTPVKTKQDLCIPFSWEERHPICLERFFYLPKQFDHQEQRLAWRDLFGNDRPVCMELCSGNGQWIGERAKQYPSINWVAVELRFDRARKIWLKSFRENLPNLYTVCGEGATFLRYYAPPKSVERAFINFPDPWPKLRHAKHRLVQAPFISVLAQTVQSRVTLATDDAAYREQMIQEFAKEPSWQREVDPQEDYGDSFFANLWKNKGRLIYYLQFVSAESPSAGP